MDNRKPIPVMDMLKALADESRLSLLRTLAEGEMTVGELARRINLGEPTVSHHLSRLRKAGLATLRMAGNQRFYRVNETGLARFKKLVVEIEKAPPRPTTSEEDYAWVDALGWDAWDSAVLCEHTECGRITFLPGKQKKLIVILRWVATLFEAGRMYTEKEVNAVIRQVYEEDYVSLRRDLVDMGYLRRERGGGNYWLAEADVPSA